VAENLRSGVRQRKWLRYSRLGVEVPFFAEAVGHMLKRVVSRNLVLFESKTRVFDDILMSRARPLCTAAPEGALRCRP
jgi:hypothetical protein